MFSMFVKNGDKKRRKNVKPIRSLLLVGAFLFLFSFIILLPIYKTSQMTPDEHLQKGLTALDKEKYDKAKTHLLKAAQSQNAQAFYTLGVMELEGKNQEKKAHPTEAASYFEKAANLGLKEAQYNLALLYDRGDGVSPDRKKALDWGLLAAAQGYVDAKYAVAVWLERGYSGKAEPYLALTFYEDAAMHGHQNAMTTLISIYAGGTEIPQNKERSAYWREQLKLIRAPQKVKPTKKTSKKRK